MMEDYLKTLVGFYPISSNQEAVRRLLAYAQERLGGNGLHTKLLTYKGVHNLYAGTTDTKHAKVLLQAHIDVVPGENQPFKVTEDSYEGRGTYDMLFAAACYLRLVDELANRFSTLSLGILLSGDEELSGENGVKAFLEDGYTTDVCILPDAGDGYGTLSTGAKGICELTIRIHGKAHHGSRPWEGDGAAIKLVHFLAEAEKLFDTSSRDNSTMTVATLHAGDVANRGPATADAALDIRYKDKTDLSRIRQKLDGLRQAHNGEIIEMLAGDDYQLDTSNPLVAQFLDLYERQVGKPIVRLTAPGSSDARFFTKYDIPVIMWRPDGGGAHGDNEWVSRESIEQFYKLLKDYIIRTATMGSK